MKYKIVNIQPPSQDAGSILIIYTGGTLGMVYNEAGSLVPFNFGKIKELVPTLKNYDIGITVISFPEPVDSSNMTPAEWRSLAYIIFENYSHYDGFIVLHGTDTMAYTASAVSYMFQGLNKPIIFTGAQIPIGQLRSDARENLITAIQIASAREEGEPIIKDVAIYFNFALLRGNRAQKVRSSTFAAFESQNYPRLASSGIFIEYFYSNMLGYSGEGLKYQSAFDPNVILIKIFPGLSQTSFESMLEVPGLKGVILETFGSGNVMKKQWLFDGLSKAIADGKVILNVSQCSGGEVIQGRYESSKIFDDLGVIGGGDITSEAAITKLMFLLGNEKSVESVKNKLCRPLVGEMDA